MRRVRKGREYLFENQSGILCVSFSSDNRYILCSFSDCELLIYSIVNNTLYKRLRTEQPLVHHAMTPDGNLFLSCFEGSRELNIWYNQIGRIVAAEGSPLIKFEI
jgi:WD40 repeat protein